MKNDQLVMLSQALVLAVSVSLTFCICDSLSENSEKSKSNIEQKQVGTTKKPEVKPGSSSLKVDDLKLAAQLRDQGIAYQKLGLYEKADVLLAQALVIYSRELGEHDPATEVVVMKRLIPERFDWAAFSQRLVAPMRAAKLKAAAKAKKI